MKKVAVVVVALSIAIPLAAGADSSSRTVAGISVGGAGVIAAGIGAYFVYNAVDSRARFVDPSYQIYKDAPGGNSGFNALSESERKAYFDGLWSSYTDNLAQYETEALLGTGLAAGGVVLIGISLFLLLLNESPAEQALEFPLRVTPGSGIVTVSFTIEY